MPAYEDVVEDPRIEVGLLVLLGALMFIVQGVLDLFALQQIAAFGFTVSSWVSAILAVPIVFGIFLIVFDFLYYKTPESRNVLGTLIIAFAIFGLLFGGGILVGTLLATLGGIFAVVLPHESTRPEDWSALGTPADSPAPLQPAKGSILRPSAEPVQFASSTIVRYCLACGARNPTVALRCAQCGVGLPSAAPSLPTRGRSGPVGA